MQKYFLPATVMILATTLGSRSALAQAAQAEIVVPQFNFFGVNTTVSVPDRGHSSLGGVNRAATGRNEFWPSFGRGDFVSRSATGAGVTMHIIDFDEMERAMSGREPEPIGAVRDFGSGVRRYAAGRGQATPVKTADAAADARPKSAPTEPAKDKAETEVAAKVAHAADLLKRGQDAEARGKLKVASLYYKSVVSLDVAPTAKLAQDRLLSLEVKMAGR